MSRKPATACRMCRRTREEIESSGGRLYDNGSCRDCMRVSNANRSLARCYRCKATAEAVEAAGHKIHRNGYCTSCVSEYTKTRRQRADVREKGHRDHKAYCKRRPDLVNARARRRNARIKLEVFAHYGTRCACCGEHRVEFLSIDHINGDGAEHRRSGVGPGIKIYYWLIRNGYPDGFRLLCMNCNCSLAQWGYCPHGNVTVGVEPASPEADTNLK